MKRYLVLLVVLAGCKIVAPGTLPLGADAGPADRGAAVCAHLRALGCPEGRKSPGGETCEALYFRVSDALDGRCIVGAQSVVELQEDCNVPCGAAP